MSDKFSIKIQDKDFTVKAVDVPEFKTDYDVPTFNIAVVTLTKPWQKLIPRCLYKLFKIPCTIYSGCKLAGKDNTESNSDPLSIAATFKYNEAISNGKK